jgi:hypothetical protein
MKASLVSSLYSKIEATFARPGSPSEGGIAPSGEAGLREGKRGG